MGVTARRWTCARAGIQRGDWDVDDETNLRFYDRKTGRYLCDFMLVEAALAAAEERIRQLQAQLSGEQS